MNAEKLVENLIPSVTKIKSKNVKILSLLVRKVLDKNVGNVGDVPRLPSEIILPLETVNQVIDAEKYL